ncbi:NAD(P)H-dependent oxidoreductase [Novosphingobium sp. KCTC 2891]|uniref:NADPH-dependent FMN reductase n=1 Tax=Novosphingobium sp. KCTC 2891 TaxID=2989730 RepID=UPI002221DE22|nr:NAD(P)H-dependent oxidoreductase [Novosphingobium sp. KCTC 2891]MCW1384058.1 NAD(P)H-dependent oxidoreductase [Novosphingobium sp. KCTC 2891]
MLNLLVFLGSARDSAPPRPVRLGLRVARQFELQLIDKGHSVELIDPLSIDLPASFKPHFAYAKGAAPAALGLLAEKIEAADGYVMVSPEYNHSMSPALAHLLNHFGSSLFSYKPSAIVTYSAGQWGGARAAIGMRTFLSELGCLPVSAMIHIPKAQEVLAESGDFGADTDAQSWQAYFGRAIAQLEWWAAAARAQREDVGLPAAAQAFRRDPSQRNAP